MWHGIALCLSLLGTEEVSVRPLQGDTQRGTLLTLTEKEVVIRAATGEVRWEASAVQSVKPANAANPSVPEENPAQVTVELTDNSNLVGDQVTMATGNAELRLQPDASLSIPTRVLRGVRFRRQSDELQKQWSAIAATVASSDQLVVRKAKPPEGAAGPAAVVLDQLEGIVHGITAAGVSFEFDNERINVPLEKVEGILFHQRQADSWPDPICRVRDARGGEWQVLGLALADGRLRLRTVGGVQGELPWDRVVDLDFAAGNLVFLSDLKPESFEWRPYLVTPATPAALAKWFSLRRDKTADGSVLTFAGQSYEKGLSVHSRSLLSYRLTKEFRHFQGVAGIDERFRGPANLRLVISGDERTLLERDMRGSDPPFEFDLDLAGVRRLRILVDFGDDRSDAGDHLLLCNARLTK